MIYELGNLPRNNWKAALATCRKMKAEGTWRPYLAQYLYNLQDDPEPLMEAMRQNSTRGTAPR